MFSTVNVELLKHVNFSSAVIVLEELLKQVQFGNICNSLGASGSLNFELFCPQVVQEYKTNRCDQLMVQVGRQEFSTAQGSWPFPERPKPPSTIRELAAIALDSMPDKKGSVKQICDYIAKNFPYYRQNSLWQNTIKSRIGDKRYFIRLPKQFAYTEYSVTESFMNSLDIETLKSKLQQQGHMDTDN